MITVNVAGIGGVRALVTGITEQLPFITAVAINTTAFAIRKAEQEQMRRVFDRPTPFVINSVYVQRATKQTLTAIVGPNDYFSRGTLAGRFNVWENIISPHVQGGTRLRKASEERLRRAGILPDGWFTVPGQAAKLNAYGNMNPGELVAIMSWLGAMGQYAGDNPNRSTREGRRRNRLERRGESYVAFRPGNPWHLAPGIYLRTSSALKPILMFVSSATYRPRLDWFGVAERTINETIDGAFNDAIELAIRTSR